MEYRLINLPQNIEIKRIATLFYMEYDKNYSFEGEKHDFWEMVYCDHGEATISFDDELYTLKKGYIAFHQPQEFHILKAEGVVSPNIIVVSFECDSPYMKSFAKAHLKLNEQEISMLSRIVFEGNNTFIRSIHKREVYLEPRSEMENFAGQQYIKNLLELFIIDLLRGFMGKRLEYTPTYILPKVNTAIRHELLVESVIKYFEDNIQKALTSEEICAAFFVSKAHLAYVFYKVTGKSFMKTFSDIKLEKAKVLLRNCDFTITQISEMLGYNSIHYFSKRFKIVTGMSPSEYINSIKIQLQLEN